MPTTIEEKKVVTEEVDLKLEKMKRLPRGSFKAKKGETDVENCKVKISLYLDKDVLRHFRERAEDPNVAPYQTQINNELRQVMEKDAKEKSYTEDELLENKSFLRALKKKLEMV